MYLTHDRQYLFVPAHEAPIASQLGARWCHHERCWYVKKSADLTAFSPWIPYKEGDELDVICDAAYVAELSVACQHCSRATKVICIHCRGGLAGGHPYRLLTATAPNAVDDGLARWLKHYHPQFRKVRVPAEFSAGCDPKPERPVFVYVNHCEHCGTIHDQMYLEKEWDDVFNWWPDGEREGGGKVTLTAIPGTVKLGGDLNFIA